MNISENLIRIKDAKDNIIKSLKNKGVSINDNTLINEIPTIIDNAEIGGGGDTPSVPTELVPKYEGASVFRIVVLKDECEIGFAPFRRHQNSEKISYVIDWGDGTIEEIDTDSHIYHIYNIKGVYDINCYNFNHIHYIYTNKEIECVNGVQYLNAFDNPKNDSYSFVYNNNKEYDYMCTNILVGSNLEVYNISNNPYLETIYITYIPTSSSLASVYYKYQNNTKLRIFKTDFDFYVGRGYFSDCISLESIITPNGVTLANESSLFSGCKQLKNILLNFNSYYKQINTSTFSNCSSLTSINIPNGFTSIGSSAFSGCSSLQNISIPNSVTSIGSSVFSNCSSLQNISIPNSVTSIGSSAFSGCTCLQSIILESLTAPTIQSNSFPTSSFKYSKRYLYVPKDSVGYNEGNWKTYLIDKGWELQYIEEYEKTPTTLKLKTTSNFFHNLQVIGQVNLIDYELINDEYIYYFDDKIIELIQGTFYNEVLEEIELPEGLEIIGGSAFSGCSSLTSINIPETVTSIGTFAFSNCSSLQNISIPNGVTSIGQFTFNSCSSLQNISIPNSVTSIGGSAFSGCSNLQTITSLNPTAPTLQYDTFNNIGTSVPSGTPKILRVPEGATGYDSGNWKSYVVNKGYTLTYVPLSEL